MEQVQRILLALKLWQLSFVISIALLSLGFTGQLAFTDVELRAGKGTAAIVAGIVFFIGAVVLRYIPPPETRIRNGRPKIAISPTQLALAAAMQDWTNFENATEIKTADYDLRLPELQQKNTSLRLELGTLQGILMRRVDKATGKHQVKVRTDETVWRPSG